MEIIPLPQRRRNRKLRAIVVPAQAQTVIPRVRRAVVQQPQQMVIVGGPSKSSRRNKKRRALKRLNTGNGLAPQMSPSGVVQSYLQPQPVGMSTGRSRMTAVSSSLRNALQKEKGTISQQGLSFLKCAFAAPDFDGSNVYGVPDDYGGKSLAVKHRAVTPWNFSSANADYYFVLAPVPGIAFYWAQVTAGVAVPSSLTWIPVPYSNFTTIFPVNASGGGLSANTSKFRMVSTHFELVPTVNNNTWTGNIQAFKLPLQWTDSSALAAATIGLTYRTLTGVQGINNTDADMYSGPFNLGVYTGAYNKGAKFDFNAVWTDQTALPFASNFNAAAGDYTALQGSVPGFDNNFETTVIKVSGMGVNVANSALIRSWACVEYQFTPGTVMYESQISHDSCDDLAVKIYRRLILELPIGVSYLDNESFWARVLAICATLGVSLSGMPGPYGAIAGGVGGLAAGLRSLIV